MVKINSVKFGEIEIDGKTYFSDMIIWWDGKIEYKEKSHLFDANDFLKIYQRKPEVIIIGTGMEEGLVKILPEVEELAEERKIEIFKELSPKAIKIFNAFVSDGKKVVAVIHINC